MNRDKSLLKESMKTKEMQESDFEKSLKPIIDQAEQSVDGQTLSRLTAMRHSALSQKNHWFSEYKRLFSASLVTAALFGVLIYPQADKLLNGEQPILDMDDSVTLLMEDPEFYLWLNETGLLVTER